MQENYFGKKSRFIIDLGLSAVSIHLLYIETYKRIKKLSKLANNSYPLSVFGQAICAGYESAVSEMTLGESSKSPVLVELSEDVSATPGEKPTITPSEKRVFSNNILVETQDNIRDYIFSVDRLKRNFWTPFKKSFLKHKAKVDKLDALNLLSDTEAIGDRFARELLSGQDISYSSLSDFDELIFMDRTLRQATGAQKSSLYRYIEYGMRLEFALLSATASTFFFNIVAMLSLQEK